MRGLPRYTIGVWVLRGKWSLSKYPFDAWSEACAITSFPLPQAPFSRWNPTVASPCVSLPADSLIERENVLQAIGPCFQSVWCFSKGYHPVWGCIFFWISEAVSVPRIDRPLQAVMVVRYVPRFWTRWLCHPWSLTFHRHNEFWISMPTM